MTKNAVRAVESSAQRYTGAVGSYTEITASQRASILFGVEHVVSFWKLVAPWAEHMNYSGHGTVLATNH